MLWRMALYINSPFSISVAVPDLFTGFHYEQVSVQRK